MQPVRTYKERFASATSSILETGIFEARGCGQTSLLLPRFHYKNVVPIGQSVTFKGRSTFPYNVARQFRLVVFFARLCTICGWAPFGEPLCAMMGLDEPPIYALANSHFRRGHTWRAALNRTRAPCTCCSSALTPTVDLPQQTMTLRTSHLFVTRSSMAKVE